MMEFKKEKLNKLKYSMRASQAVQQFGPGAMFDFQDQTLMTASPIFWSDGIKRIHDERMEKLLDVDYFGLPSSDDQDEGIAYVRFPEWYFCPKCRRIRPLKEWIADYKKSGKNDYDPDMLRTLRCTKCYRNLVVSRFVTVCENGHIDDFPWKEWAHLKKKSMCGNPKIQFLTSSNPTEGMGGMTVKCETCQASNNLKEAFYPTIFADKSNEENAVFNFKCKGRHPWKHKKENCHLFPKTQQRGSSSVYFSVMESSLVIPPYSNRMNQTVINSHPYEKYIEWINDDYPEYIEGLGIQKAQEKKEKKIDVAAKEISESKGISYEDVKSIIKRQSEFNKEQFDKGTYSTLYRLEEYKALTGKVKSLSVRLNDDDFIREATNIEEYSIPCLKDIHLINRLREIRVLTGFSRLNPVSPGDNKGDSAFVKIKEDEGKWYPAYEVRGEGIFFEFDDGFIKKWLNNNSEMFRRAKLLSENTKKSFINRNSNKEVTPEYMFIHTISHLLIKQMSFECGYNIASLRERIYCSDTDDSELMRGVLIYTADGDSEGTLGGLVRLGQSDVFPSIFRKAIEDSIFCSNDPICSLSEGQGRDSLNLCACYSCLLIPETSCENFNQHLDRAVISGTLSNRAFGSFSNELFGIKSDINLCLKEISNDKAYKTVEDLKNVKKLEITSRGNKIISKEYSNLWRSLMVEIEDENELNLLRKLASSADKFDNKECPIENCTIMIDDEEYDCDLIWEESKVLYFSEENENEYIKACESEWTCFLGKNPNITAEELLNAIKER